MIIPYENTLIIPIGLVINGSLTLDELTEKYIDPAIRNALSGVDDRHEKGCVRRYGAIPDTWVPHHECACHKGEQ